MNVLKLTLLVAIGLCPSFVSAQTTLSVSDSVSIHGIDVATTIDGVQTTSNVLRTNADGTINNEPSIYDTGNQNPGIVSSDPALAATPVVPTIFYEYSIRERNNPAQLDRRLRSFIQFDVSAIPAAELADPNFVATFTVDYIGNLNVLNPGLNVGLGQIVDGPWDSTTTLPPIDFSFNSTDLGLLVENVSTNAAPISGLTVDITALVQGWADGSIPNYGVTFNVPAMPVGIGNQSNSAFFSNATIVTSIGAPMVLKGDVDLSNVVDFLDIAPFIDVLANGGSQPEADANCDGEVSFLDIAPFIAILAGP